MGTLPPLKTSSRSRSKMPKSELIAIDTETTQKSEYSFGAWPFAPDNKMVFYGVYAQDSGAAATKVGELHDSTVAYPGEYTFVTQAGKFDLHYARRFGNPNVRMNVLVNSGLWDTQVAEYILTGQQTKMASMDDMSFKYGLPVKDDEIKQAFKDGKGADELDEKAVLAYLRADVTKTYKIAAAQIEQASPAQANLILRMGKALQATAEMEFNGFNVEPHRLEVLKIELVQAAKELEDSIVRDLSKMVGFSIPAFKVDSRTFWSAYIFGGDFEFEWKVPDGVYKSGLKLGTPKYKWHSHTHTFGPILDKFFAEETEQKGIYKIDDTVLELASKHSDIVNWYRGLKTVKKLLKTYVGNVESNCAHSYDGRLHPNYNLTTTDTGRLSCSSPNMQNAPRADQGAWEKEFRSCFTSRWGDEGLMIEADYKALEMIGFAVLNKDPVLIDDLKAGRDPHTETGKAVFDHEMNEEERVSVKKVNFGTIYGGGAATIAKQSGIDVKLARKIQKALKTRYAAGFKEAKKYTELNRIESPTGRTYITLGSYTKGMNYRVQGFSTGDLVPTMQGVLFERLMESEVFRDSCLLVSNEHDKFILDCKESIWEEAIEFIREVMESAPEVMWNVYGFDMMGLETPVSIKVGLDLGHMEKVGQ